MIFFLMHFSLNFSPPLSSCGPMFEQPLPLEEQREIVREVSLRLITPRRVRAGIL